MGPVMADAMKAVKAKAMKAAAKTAMKGMKVMKAAMKAMKAMKKVKEVSVIARGKLAKAAVFNGKKQKTVGGLTKATLIMSKTASARGKTMYAQCALKKWCDACKQARKALGVTGFCAVGGKTAQGQALYAKAKAILGK